LKGEFLNDFYDKIMGNPSVEREMPVYRIV